MERKKGKNFDNKSNSVKVDCAFVLDPHGFPPLSRQQMSNVNRTATSLSRENLAIKHRTTDVQYDSNHVFNTQTTRRTKYRSIYNSSASINLCRTYDVSTFTKQVSDIPTDLKLSYSAAASRNSDKNGDSYQNTYNTNSFTKKSDNYHGKYQCYDHFVPNSSEKKVVNYQNAHSSNASKNSVARFGSLEKYELPDLSESQQIKNNGRASFATGKNHHFGHQYDCSGATSGGVSFEAEFDTILKCTCDVRSKRGSLATNEIKMEGMKRREKKQTIAKGKYREEKKSPNDFQSVENTLKKKTTSEGEINEEERFPIEEVEAMQNERGCQTSKQNVVGEPKARRKAKEKNKKARILREIKQHRIRRNSQSKADQSLMEKPMMNYCF